MLSKAFRKALAPDPADRITFDELIAVIENPEVAEDFGYDGAIHDVESDDGDPASGTGTFAFGASGRRRCAEWSWIKCRWVRGSRRSHRGSRRRNGRFAAAEREIIAGGTEVLGVGLHRTEQLNVVERTSVTERLSIADGQATEID